MNHRTSGTQTDTQKHRGAYYAILLLCAFLLRSVLAVLVEGYPNDIACFKGWAIHSASAGLSDFYSGMVFADYPPGYIYVLYVVGKIREFFSLDYSSAWFLFIVKLPQLVSDIVLTHIVFVLSRKYLSLKSSYALAAIYAFNPAIVINSAPWGQVDSFYTLTVVIFVLLAVQKRFLPASLACAFAVLVKPQALMFAPLWLFAHLNKPVKVKTLILNAVYAFAFFVALVIPFSLHKEPLWIVHHYAATLSSYPYATFNAFNLFALTGGNLSPVTDSFFLLSYNTWGLIFITLTVIFTFFIYTKRKDSAALICCALLIVSSTYVLGPKMHERYLYPALALALLTYVYLKDKRFLFIFAGFSVTLFINEASVLDYGIREIFFIPADDPVLMIISAANVLLLLYLFKIGYELIREPAEKSLSPLLPLQVEKQYNGFTKKDYILAGILVLVNAVLLIYNLGSMSTPQTYWKPKTAGEGVYFDFGSEKEIAKTCFFSGLGDGKYALKYSNDLTSWRSAPDLEQKAVFEWRCADTHVKARYMKLTVKNPGSQFYEIAFVSLKTGKVIPIKNVIPFKLNSESSNMALNIADEQDKVTEKPSYFNSTYFDEIYHARTAYEHLHGINYYETTHPPLGKLFIALGIWAFGMNPFGWRIVGALFGIATIFVIYAFGLRLFKSSRYAFISTFLMTFDFMHFTLSRIATIDVYAVFFIALMYYFMYIYISESSGSGKNLLIPLALSGLSFAFGISVKWICVYAGVGLAVLFFYSLFLRYKDFGIKNGMIFKTIGFAMVFFVIIPLIIYSLSYLPVKSEGRTWPATAILNQKDMYDYHTNLKAAHPYSSQWYSWPLMMRPLWAYSGGDYLPKDEVKTITIMGNPAVWWLSIPAFSLMLLMVYRQRRISIGVIVVTVGFLAQYLPWILVPRLTFIYHFYASVPFLIFSITYVIMWLEEQSPKRYKLLTYSYLIIVFVLFVMFYPVLTGVTVSRAYVDTWLRWFNSWVFFS
ncbi:phospholipid carrier-dependent glycosyltransferase [Candidatus Magnetomonas plexicatena]|uniref:phospholipid carrier-dependent glycosyltransferase n=1 Tax=Candidatus Magnetomonas plexicatena TaxID=2552947 RepID=UPI00110115DC|nr:phospholipid carrier-dependent glycosyltransferase [Nitrospirales bacterium LBB_01]